MAIALESQTRNLSGINVSSYTLTGVVISGSNKFLVVCVGLWDNLSGQQVSSVVLDPGGLNTAFSVILKGDQANSQGDGVRAELWGLVAPTAGTYSVEVTISAQCAQIGVAARCYSGVDQATPYRTPAKNYANSLPGGSPDPVDPATVSATSAVSDVVVSALNGWSDTAPRPNVNSPQTGSTQSGAGSNMQMGDSDGPGSATSTTVTWNMPATDPNDNAWSLVAASLQPVSDNTLLIRTNN